MAYLFYRCKQVPDKFDLEEFHDGDLVYIKCVDIDKYVGCGNNESEIFLTDAPTAQKFYVSRISRNFYNAMGFYLISDKMSFEIFAKNGGVTIGLPHMNDGGVYVTYFEKNSDQSDAEPHRKGLFAIVRTNK